MFIKDWSPGLSMNPVDEPLERDIMSTFIRELIEKFKCGLYSNFTTSRENSSKMEEEVFTPPTDNCILVGSSHMDRTATDLRKQGETLLNLASPHWRLN